MLWFTTVGGVADGTGTLEPPPETGQGAFVSERKQLRVNCAEGVGWPVAERSLCEVVARRMTVTAAAEAGRGRWDRWARGGAAGAGKAAPEEAWLVPRSTPI